MCAFALKHPTPAAASHWLKLRLITLHESIAQLSSLKLFGVGLATNHWILFDNFWIYVLIKQKFHSSNKRRSIFHGIERVEYFFTWNYSHLEHWIYEVVCHTRRAHEHWQRAYSLRTSFGCSLNLNEIHTHTTYVVLFSKKIKIERIGNVADSFAERAWTATTFYADSYVLTEQMIMNFARSMDSNGIFESCLSQLLLLLFVYHLAWICTHRSRYTCKTTSWFEHKSICARNRTFFMPNAKNVWSFFLFGSTSSSTDKWQMCASTFSDY